VRLITTIVAPSMSHAIHRETTVFDGFHRDSVRIVQLIEYLFEETVDFRQKMKEMNENRYKYRYQHAIQLE
jgi:hypothetical protein